MNDEQLIELVHQYAVLYDLSHPKYMDTSFKHGIWSKIGTDMKEDGKYLYYISIYFRHITQNKCNI